MATVVLRLPFPLSSPAPKRPTQTPYRKSTSSFVRKPLKFCNVTYFHTIFFYPVVVGRQTHGRGSSGHSGRCRATYGGLQETNAKTFSANRHKWSSNKPKDLLMVSPRECRYLAPRCFAPAGLDCSLLTPAGHTEDYSSLIFAQTHLFDGDVWF